MNQRTIEILEYSRIRDEIAGHCMSQEGKDTFLRSLPRTDDGEIALLKEYGAFWMEKLFHDTPPAFTGWPGISSFISRIGVEGSSLNLEEFYYLGLFCTSAQKFRSWGIKCQHDVSDNALSPPGDILDRITTIPDLSSEEEAIFRVVDRSTGDIRDLPEIRAIRQEIRRIKVDIEHLINNYLTDDSLRQGLQAKLPTVKDGRQVIAMKVGARNRVKGIVHEVSQSGQTVYVEPEDVIARNNDLLAEENRLDREIARILRELTEQLCPSYENITFAHQEMVFFDGIGAAASWGKAHSCSYIQSAATVPDSESVIQLKKARHPLLRRAAVPIDLTLTPGGRQLIITGPNTGGKTVSLKTVALLSLMNQSGWPVPAQQGSFLPIFDYIGCDIGDEQSLDQSLSTFSAHMRNIAEILSSASDRSLILLDELGSGTDPQEGSAIAMAVLDTLMEKNSVVLVTTHHGILKNYGYMHDTCINASVEFDQDTLSPTYRIVMGIPGESHALDVAGKNGLDVSIIEKARSYLDDERADISALIRGLTSKHETLDLLEQKKRNEEREINEKRRSIDLKELQLRQKEYELREQGFRKLTVLLNEGRRDLENLVRRLREGEITREKTLEVKSWMNSLEEKISEEYESLQEEQKTLKVIENDVAGDRATNGIQKNAKSGKAKRKTAIEPDMEVYVGDKRHRGTVLRQEKSGKWLVSVGRMKMTVSSDELEVVAASGKKESSMKIDYSADIGDRAIPAFELRLLGMRSDDAQKALERQFDLAVMKGLHEFSIIHGKGNGVLQSMVQGFLRDHADQCSFTYARPENGGSGKTIVALHT